MCVCVTTYYPTERYTVSKKGSSPKINSILFSLKMLRLRVRHYFPFRLEPALLFYTFGHAHTATPLLSVLQHCSCFVCTIIGSKAWLVELFKPSHIYAKELSRMLVSVACSGLYSYTNRSCLAAILTIT